MGSNMASWQDIAKNARDHRDATLATLDPPLPTLPDDLPLDVTHLPRELLTAEEVLITELTPEEIVERIAKKTFTAVQVTKAFLRRAGLAQKLVNCVTELLPETALDRAAYLDSYLNRHGKPIGPLHGLPISVKEHVGMKGRILDAGFISWRDRIAEEDAHILTILLDAGAVLYVRTTQPQTLMHLETSSNLYGETVNPFNRALTSGGSSGGEGALIGMRGSPLGIGTDIGGSIRSPAANCGLYGLRPTSFRLPMDGMVAAMMGQEQIIPVTGPLSTSLEGVKLFMKTVIAAKPWVREPSLIPLPWKYGGLLKEDEEGRKTVKVAVLWDDGVVRPHPPVLRALKEVAEKLKGVEGVEVVDWKPYKHEEASQIINTLYFADGGAETLAAIEASGEPLRPLSQFILKDNLDAARKLSIAELWEWSYKRDKYRVAHAKLWGDIDIIMCPAGPGAAPPLNNARYWGYTSQWNLLDYPSLIVPITRVDPKVDVADAEYSPRNEKDAFNHQLYEPTKYANAPVSLQFVGNRYEDEKVVEAVEYLQSRAGFPFSNFV